MSSTSTSTTARVDILLDWDHANKNLIETLFSMIVRAADAETRLGHLWIARGSSRTTGAKLPVTPRLWILAKKFREVSFIEDMYKGKYASIGTSQYLRGFYEACLSFPEAECAMPSHVAVVSNRVASFTEDAFYLGENVESSVWSTPAHIEEGMPQLFAIDTAAAGSISEGPPPAKKNGGLAEGSRPKQESGVKQSARRAKTST